MSEEFTIEDRARITQDLLNIFAGTIKGLSRLKWVGKDGVWTIIVRSVLVRQYEALQSIVELAQNKRAHLCVPLLRPAVEEHLWMAFLQTLRDEDRERFLLAKSQVEIFETLKGQWDDAGANEMTKMGFTEEFFEKMRLSSERSQEQLREIGGRLGWRMGRQSIPRTWFVAEKTGNENLYSVIYHATSRTVHFTVAELLRRGWGNSDQVVISSDTMDQYWAKFSLYWGTRLFALTLLGLSDEFERLDISLDLGDEETLDSTFRKFAETGVVPIITPQELNHHLNEPDKAFRLS